VAITIPAPVISLRVGLLGREPSKIPELQPLISELKWVDTEKKADKLSLTIRNETNRFPDDPVFELGAEMRISWGFTGKMGPVRRFVIQAWYPGIPYFKVEANGLGILLHKDKAVRSWHQVRRSDVAREIATSNGYTEAQQDIEDTTSILPTVQQTGWTDADLMRRLAAKESKNGVEYIYYVDDKGFHFHPRRIGQTPRRRIVYIGAGMGDMLGFPNFQAKTKGKRGKHKKDGQDPITKTPIRAAVSNKTTPGRPGLGAVQMLLESADSLASERQTNASSAPRTVEETKTELLVHEQRGTISFRKGVVATSVGTTSASSQAEAESEAGAAFSKHNSTPVKCTFSIVGDPYVTSRSVVTLDGLGLRMSGPYYINETTHTVTPGDFNVACTAHRDGLTASNTSSGDTPSEAKVNDQKGPDGKGPPTLKPALFVDKQRGDNRVKFIPSDS
jgi:uncharacterized protein